MLIKSNIKWHCYVVIGLMVLSIYNNKVRYYFFSCCHVTTEGGEFRDTCLHILKFEVVSWSPRVLQIYVLGFVSYGPTKDVLFGLVGYGPSSQGPYICYFSRRFRKRKPKSNISGGMYKSL